MSQTETPGARMLSALGPLYVVNLPERTDRRRGFARQLARLGLTEDAPGLTVFAATRVAEAAGFPTPGTRGCFLSHLGVLEAALSSGAQGVILCEDDLDFAADAPRRLDPLLQALAGRDWDILYLGHERIEALAGTADAAGLAEVVAATPVLTAHFVVFRRSALALLIPYLKAILDRPKGHPEGGPMHVDGAYSRFRADHPALRTLAVFPAMGHQRPSRTDIHALGWYDRTLGIAQLVQLARRAKARLRR